MEKIQQKGDFTKPAERNVNISGLLPRGGQRQLLKKYGKSINKDLMSAIVRGIRTDFPEVYADALKLAEEHIKRQELIKKHNERNRKLAAKLVTT